MIPIKEVEFLHEMLIATYGGSTGTQNLELLKSALMRPFQTFDGRELYPSVIEKAAALIESILSNHPFVDGNKRTGYNLMRLFLNHHELDIAATMEEKYQFVIGIASGNYDFDGILEWLKVHVVDTSGA